MGSGSNWKRIEKIKQADGTLYRYEHRTTGQIKEVFKPYTTKKKLKDSRDMYGDYSGL